ncbi:galactokinase [Candidatus Leptofilum sp.]|uniref:galactokinase n=1 Tax=Candidatus Leptofilum sp. TaxID=3241576 RepID=UPI003B58E638
MSITQLSKQAQVQHIFRELVGRDPAVVVRASGVVQLLGGELEPSEGWTLAGAIEPAVWLAAAPTTDNRVTVRVLNLGETAAFQLPHLELFASSVGGNWINYPMGAAWALQNAGQQLVGLDVVLVSDLPQGVGLGSSTAVTLAFIHAWEAVAGFELDPLSRAHLAQKTEKEYVGVQAGLMTPFVCAASRANELLLVNGRTFTHESLPLPANISLILVDSGERGQAAILRERARECAEATAVLRQYLPHIKTLRDVSPDELELLGHHLPEPLRRRASHVVSECARVKAAATALQDGDLPALGRLLRQSHLSLRDSYEASTPALDSLAATAWATPSCIGARLGGSGFLQVLVEDEAVFKVLEKLNEVFVGEYASTEQSRSGRTPPSLVTKFTEGASSILVSDML